MSIALRSLPSLVLLVGAGANVAAAQVLRERDVGGDAGDFFGCACANAGDVDGDATDDFIVGAYGFEVTGLGFAGRAVVYSGATGAVIRSHEGTAYSERLGMRVTGAGDLDADGFGDYLVSAPFHDLNVTTIDVGRVIAFSGRTGAALWSRTGSAKSDVFGTSISGLGDVDGDGRGDVVVGTLNDEVFVLDADGNVLHHLTGSDYFGYAVAGCGDLDGDGVNDFLVDQPYYDQPSPLRYDVGAVHVYSGGSGGWIRTITGTNEGDALGYALAALGDVDADGVDDFIAGSALSAANDVDSGIVRVVSGATGATIREQPGDAAGDYHGYSVCGMGDANRDGVPDYAVGIPTTGAGPGRVRVCSGSDGSTIHDWIGVTGATGTNVQLGFSVASGDWNGDGVADLLAGDLFFVDAASASVGSLDVELMCPAWRASYGAGWPGTNGIPGLTSAQDPEVGAPIDVLLGNSRGATTPALLFVGLQPANVPLAGNGTLLVAPLFPLALSVPAGGLTLNAALPADPALCFVDVFLQALELDPSATKGLSFTPGLQLHCGFDLP